MQAIILAGGLGSRLLPFTKDIPKPMVPLAGKPLLEYQILLLVSHGITDFFIIANHRAEKITEFFGNGSRWGSSIQYYIEDKPLGTVGGIKAMENKIHGDFLVLYGDVMVDMDISRLIDFHKNKNSDCTLVLHPGDHPFDSDLVALEPDGRISEFYPKPRDPGRYYRNMVNAGVYVFTKKVLTFLEPGEKADFGKDIFPLLPGRIKMYGYNTSEYLKDMGTLDRLEQVSNDLNAGKVSRRNLKNKQKAIFLDRDGVLNEDKPFISSPEMLEVFSYTGKAIKKINDSGFIAVVVTNQPVVARNLCTENELRTIHNKLDTVLAEENAWLDALYYCPHHPDQGYPGENPAYKIDCDCRKPKPGMLLQAAREFNIDLSKSFLIGDDERDIQAGKKAGVTTIGVKTGKGLKDSKIAPDHLVDDVTQAIDFILTGKY